MFGPLGFPEILFILALALLIFGPKRLPQIGRTVGKAVGEFRRATTDLKRSFDADLSLDEPPSRPPAAVAKPAAKPEAPAAEADEKIEP